MSKFDKYRGIFPAFYAAYDEEGNISPERIHNLVKYFERAGVQGLYVGGSSGECIYQTVSERKQVLKEVMRATNGELIIIAHVAAPSTRDSVELARHADRLGVDALAAIPPIYFLLSEQAIYDYWMSMVEATTKDFFIYNIPATTNYQLSKELYLKMITHDRVIGVKNSSMPGLDIYTFKRSGEKETIVFNGPDEQYISGRIMGADGGIGGTYGLMPELYVKLDELFIQKDIERAQALQHDLNDIIMLTQSLEGHMYDVIKSVLKMRGLNIGRARLPMPHVTQADRETLIEINNRLTSLYKKYDVAPIL